MLPSTRLGEKQGKNYLYMVKNAAQQPEKLRITWLIRGGNDFGTS